MITTIAFLICSLISAYFAINLKNESYKTFFLLFTFLNILLSFASAFYSKEVTVCTNYANSTCLNYEKTIEMPGSNAVVYGYGLLLITFFILTLIGLFIKASEQMVK
jgi:hypothetical protein